MSFRCTLKITGLPRLQGKVHWRTVTKERKAWRDKTLWAIREAGVVPPARPLARARLTFTRHSSAQPDYGDNLGQSFKSLRDALVGIIIQDDTPAVVGTPIYRWASAPPRGGYVTIEVEELGGDAPVCIACGQPLPD